MHTEGLTTNSFKGKDGSPSDLDSSCSSESSTPVQSFQQAVNEVHGGVVEEPSDLEKSHFLEVEGDLSAGKSKSEFSPEVDFLNVEFNPKADINERFLRDIAGLEGAGGVSGVVEHGYSPCVGKVNYFNFNKHVFQELHVESAALIHSCGGMASVQLPSEFREPLLADVAASASIRTLHVPNSRASAKFITSSNGVRVEENEIDEVDGALCEMVSCDINNISWAEGVDRAMNARIGWTGDVVDSAVDSDNMEFFS
ncbi:hypothetical protein GQ457_11G033600 [Hibiscus cannabinus]